MTAIVAQPPRRLAPRHLWLIPGIALGLYANVQSGQQALGLVPVLIFGIVPHLAVLLGLGQPHAPGQLAPRAVPLFNAMHRPIVPLALLAIAATGILSPFWFVGALAWLGHIVADQGFGNGLRTPDGWRRPLWLAR
jgi:hypothetical protein